MDYKPDTKVEFYVCVGQSQRCETMTAAEWIGHDANEPWPSQDDVHYLLQGAFDDWLGDNIDAGLGPAKESKL